MTSRVREQAPRAPGVTGVALEESVWAGNRRSRSWRWRGRGVSTEEEPHADWGWGRGGQQRRHEGRATGRAWALPRLQGARDLERLRVQRAGSSVLSRARWPASSVSL